MNDLEQDNDSLTSMFYIFQSDAGKIDPSGNILFHQR